jgi:hypothetical protein
MGWQPDNLHKIWNVSYRSARVAILTLAGHVAPGRSARHRITDAYSYNTLLRCSAVAAFSVALKQHALVAVGA